MCSYIGNRMESLYALPKSMRAPGSPLFFICGEKSSLGTSKWQPNMLSEVLCYSPKSVHAPGSPPLASCFPFFFIHGENPPLKIRESPPFELNGASPLFLQLVEIFFLWEVEIFYDSLSLIKYFDFFLNAYGYGKCIYAWLTWRFLQGCNPCLVW